MILHLNSLLLREWRLVWRRARDIGLALGFMVISASLFPIAVGPEPLQLSLMAGGVIWVLALIAVLMSLDRLFQHEFEDGSLEAIHLSPVPLELILLVKAILHWLSTALPLIAITPMVGLFMNLDKAAYAPLILGLLLATPSLSLVGTLGAALSVGARRSQILLTLLVLPLYIPILIFAASGLELERNALNANAHYLFLAALLCFFIIICPIAGAAALRYHNNNT